MKFKALGLAFGFRIGALHVLHAQTKPSSQLKLQVRHAGAADRRIAGEFLPRPTQ
jgi:hypothetical protein